jgi:hypothetical protein
MTWTATQVLLVAVGAVRSLLLIGMAGAALWLMHRLASPRPRRRANPSLWAGLSLLASSGVAMGMLVLRQVLVWAGGGTRWWFLLLRDPDLIGTLGYALASCLAAMGALLIIRGVHAVLYRRASGQLPRVLGGDPPPGEPTP